MSSSGVPADRTGLAASAYDGAAIPFFYDVLVAAIFAPFGGVGRLRRRALDAIPVTFGNRILELGCGTGGLTRLMLRRGAQVVAVDGSASMLARARARAPEALFLQGRIEAAPADMPDVTAGPFDVVLFAFVLHELTAADRRAALARARNACGATGIVAVLDHAVPQAGLVAPAWRAMLTRLEPPSVRDCIEGGYDADLAATGLALTTRKALAGGLAQLVLARPA